MDYVSHGTDFMKMAHIPSSLDELSALVNPKETAKEPAKEIVKDHADITKDSSAFDGFDAAAPSRAAPVPQVPNGKPTTPAGLVTSSNPMANGQENAMPQTVASRDPKAAAQAASDMKNVVRRKLTGFVGFANLPNQWHRKSVRKGFNFNVMVVGQYHHIARKF